LAVSLLFVGLLQSVHWIRLEQFVADLGWNGHPARIPELDWWDLLKDALFDSILFGDSSYNAVLWTIRIEFFGSLMVFAMVALFQHCRRRMLIYCIILGILVAAQQIHYAEFQAGLIMADNWTQQQQGKSRGLPAIMVLLIVAMSLGGLKPGWHVEIPWAGEFRIPGSGYWKFVGAILLVWVFLFGRIFVRMLEGKRLYFLGEASYGLYLLHFAVLFSLGHLTWSLLRINLGLSYHMASFLAIMVIISASLFLGLFFARCVERPSITIANKFAKWLLG
jgi:peptidoglycan/LPS O-acetylase OafA/YrhL